MRDNWVLTAPIRRDRAGLVLRDDPERPVGHIPVSAETYERHQRFINDRLARLEERATALEKTDIATAKDAEARVKQDQLLRERWPVKQILVLGGSLVVFVGGLIWQAARYPDRAEIDQIRDKVEQLRMDNATQEMHLVTLEQLEQARERRELEFLRRAP